MTLQSLTTKLQDLCHQGYAQYSVAISDAYVSFLKDFVVILESNEDIKFFEVRNGV